MPNQENFRSNISNSTEPTYFASRIVRFPTEDILLEELPGSFGYNASDNIELHFYTTNGNVLLLSTIVNVQDQDVLKNHIVTFNDGSLKSYIRIDFTKMFELNNLILTPGNYKLVINFFANEIGSYTNKKMYVQEISPSRTEIQLGFVDNTDNVKINNNKQLLSDFVQPSFIKPIAVGVSEKIFDSGVRLDDSSEGINFDNIFATLSTPIKLRIERSGVTNYSEEKINNFLQRIFTTLKTEIVIINDTRLQKNELIELIQNAIEVNIPFLRADLSNQFTVT